MQKITLVVCAAALLALAGCKVSTPGKVETAVMKEVKKTMTIGGKSDKNRLPATPENIKEGGEHFGHHCQICHGLDGHATGVPFAEKMSPPVPDLA
ncbi:MAG TPA: cytochrome c, partial [Terriglobales bacterium]|nr:cytochrome c [Terriglobales bacterium]